MSPESIAFEHDRIGTGLKLDFKAEIVFHDDLEHMRRHLHRRPVGHADNHIGGLCRRHRGHNADRSGTRQR